MLVHSSLFFRRKKTKKSCMAVSAKLSYAPLFALYKHCYMYPIIVFLYNHELTLHFAPMYLAYHCCPNNKL